MPITHLAQLLRAMQSIRRGGAFLLGVPAR